MTVANNDVQSINTCLLDLQKQINELKKLISELKKQIESMGK